MSAAPGWASRVSQATLAAPHPTRWDPLRAVPRAHGSRRIFMVFMAVLLAVTVVGPGIAPTPAAAQAVTATTTADLNLRSGPGTQFMVLRVIPFGGTVEITGSVQSGFVPVRFQGVSGFAAQDFLRTNRSPDSAPSTGTATVTTSLNLRASASTSSQILNVMPAGAQVSLLGPRQNGFAQVAYQGQTGWAHADFLRQGGSTTPPNDGGSAGPSGQATVTTSLNLRASASTSAQVINVMPPGATVNLLGQQQNGFAQVTYQGQIGWAYATFLTQGGAQPAPTAQPQPQPTTPPTTSGPIGIATVTVSLNLRASASTSAQVINVMPVGAQVNQLGPRQSGFAQVTYQGQTGWAYADFLSQGGAQQPPPTSQPQPQPTAPPTTGAPAGAQVWATTSVNMRSGPGANFSVLTVIPLGSSGIADGTSQNGYWRINWNQNVGWVAAQFLSTSPVLPIEQPAPGQGSGGNYTEAQIIQIIYDAADRYGQPRADMLRVARCESVLDPRAVNPAGSYGLFQFIPSTWATTPYASYDIFDPWASANAAGWMWSVGRRNEWVCQ